MINEDMTADEKHAARLDQHVNAPGFQFAGPEAEAAYKERAKMLRDVIELKTPPKRVPVYPLVGGYMLGYSGRTWKDGLYDTDKLIKAMIEYHKDFQPDLSNGALGMLSGGTFDILQYKLYDWPGQKLSDDVSYQMNEGEYMTGDEYPELIADPTGFLIRKFMPRIYPPLAPFQMFPNPILHVMMPWASVWFNPIGMPPFQEALKKMMEAATVAAQYTKGLIEARNKVKALGFPALTGGSSEAPFDILGDTLRGTRGILMDLYRRPDEVLEACNRLVPLAVSIAVGAAEVSGVPIIFFPLHKGADGFMSDEQFRKFYWPSLKAVMLGLVEQGITPWMFAEGGFNERLEVIADFPKGKCLWWFDQTDMKRAKDILGDVCCIAGNIPNSVLAVGTPDQVKTYCKDLIEYCGKGGGFLLGSGAIIDQAKPENIHAMIEAGKEYGVYA